MRVRLTRTLLYFSSSKITAIEFDLFWYQPVAAAAAKINALEKKKSRQSARSSTPYTNFLDLRQNLIKHYLFSLEKTSSAGSPLASELVSLFAMLILEEFQNFHKNSSNRNELSRSP